MAGRLAAELGWHLLDSGALYRVVGLIALKRGIDFDDGPSLANAARKVDIGFKESPAMSRGSPIRVLVDGVDETDAIRSAEIRTARVAGRGRGRRCAKLSSQRNSRSENRPDWLPTDGTWARWCFPMRA